MDEGLVDAAVVAGVLSPKGKGKASPQEEPLFKIKAAAEAFRDMRRIVADTLEVHIIEEPFFRFRQAHHVTRPRNSNHLHTCLHDRCKKCMCVSLSACSQT